MEEYKNRSRIILSEILKQNNIDKTFDVIKTFEKLRSLQYCYPDGEYDNPINHYCETLKGIPYSKIMKEYIGYLKLHNLLDFDGILELAYRILNSERLLYWQEFFEAILVDEYQDCSLIQVDIINLLSKKHKNITIVGDPVQSIYGFRGATKGNNKDPLFEINDCLKLGLGEKTITKLYDYLLKNNYSLIEGIAVIAEDKVFRGRVQESFEKLNN
ncbi:hypothetical protein PVNG_02397 [Plasmodium vivax North Korean]|uniref:UvrD-like helicase ATP-binding domain-containing protein n=1 Tax=Plasmodium vivax North Korean TaxID=1035514 RepID=A0A0J9TLR3_PLAVI|nr:hypothetical protein PVNG_02397 [Plasmodium vivax North Korean]